MNEVAIRNSSRLGPFFFSLILTLIIFSSTVPSALACSPALGYKTPTISERTKAATVILEVTFDGSQGTDERLYYYETASFTVHQWLKGSGPSTITVTGFGDEAGCSSPIPTRRAILFATGDPKSGKLSLNYVGLHDAVVPLSVREQIIEVVGAEPTIPESTLVTEPTIPESTLVTEPTTPESTLVTEPTIPESTLVTELTRVSWIGLVALLGAGLLIIRKRR